jgi:hypothetical protein
MGKDFYDFSHWFKTLVKIFTLVRCDKLYIFSAVVMFEGI